MLGALRFVRNSRRRGADRHRDPLVLRHCRPPTACVSLARRDNIGGVTRHMHGGQLGQDTIEGMELFFEHWTKASSLVFVQYEAFYDHLKDNSEALGVHFRRFPQHRVTKISAGGGCAGAAARA